MKLKHLHEAYTTSQRIGVHNKIMALIDKLSALRSQPISPEDKTTIEIGVQAIEREIEDLGRKLRSGDYWFRDPDNI